MIDYNQERERLWGKAKCVEQLRGTNTEKKKLSKSIKTNYWEKPRLKTRISLEQFKETTNQEEKLFQNMEENHWEKPCLKMENSRWTSRRAIERNKTNEKTFS